MSKAIAPVVTYTVVVNSVMAVAGDLHNTQETTPSPMDTGYIDVETLLDDVKGQTLKNPEVHINIVRLTHAFASGYPLGLDSGRLDWSLES